MNCPGHIQIFNQGIKSYRDLPLRIAEFGSCHRNEPSGSLHGLMRVRGFVQDDAHIFCSEEQILSESLAFIDLLRKVYADFGFSDILVKLSTRPEKRIGADESWDRAEAALAQALQEPGAQFVLHGLDLLAQGRLGPEGGRGGLGEAPRFRHLVKTQKLLPFHNII